MFNSHRPAGRVHGDGDVGGAYVTVLVLERIFLCVQ